MADGLVSVANQGDAEKITVSYLDQIQNKHDTLNKEKVTIPSTMIPADPT